MKDKRICQKQIQTAREILNIIEEVCFSKEYLQYRVNYGSNGQRDLIIRLINSKNYLFFI